MSTEEAGLTIAVVIPTLGRPELARAVRSVQAQTHLPPELIIVDNSSDPGSTKSIVEDLAPGAKLIELPYRSGPSRCRNEGARAAQAPYVAFLDDDDEFAPDYLELVAEQLRTAPQDVLYGTRIVCDLDGTALKADRLSDVPSERWLDVLYMHTNIGVGGQNVTVDRHAFLDVGGFPTELRTAEDRAFAMRCLAAGMRIHHVEAEVWCYDDADGYRAKRDASKMNAYRHIMRTHWGDVGWQTRIKSVLVYVRRFVRGKRRSPSPPLP